MYYPSMALERETQKNIITLLTHEGAWYTKVHQAGRGRRGIPDILACYRGIFIAIEVKGDSGHGVSDQQVRELQSIRAADGVGIVAYSAMEVHDVLRRIDDEMDMRFHRTGIGPRIPQLALPQGRKVVKL